ncbi:3-hydroxyisobutyryl-CoA hydrolase-like protein 2 mitochondrial [Bienertia sinuspersici]
MQRFKGVLNSRYSLQSLRFLSPYRTFLAQPSYIPRNDLVEEQVLVEGRTNSRAAILNRPSSLNAITTSMAGRLKRLYESWEENSTLGFIIMKGNGKAFCSGADVVDLYQLINEGKVEECKSFFDTLYRFVYLMGTYVKPNVAILDGTTMGAGAGVSFPGMFRLATDRTVFSHPETQLGFHPDAGASFFLSRLPGHLDDPSVVESSLAQYGDLVYPDKSSIVYKIETIDKCFSHDTVEEIFDALEKEATNSSNEWCKATLKKLKEASPLSLKVTLRSIRDGRFQPMDKCLAREYRISVNCISKRVSNDFCEGVRARLVDKDFAPKWDPPALEDVSKDMVDCYFSPFSEHEPELDLPTSLREPDM